MTRTDNQRWAVVLGASLGSGGAISAALARDPGLDIFGVHRGNHVDEAAAVEAAVAAAGRRCHMRIGEGGTPEAARQGAAELLEVAGPRSVRFFVHSIADASYGQFTCGGDGQFHPRQFDKTFERMAHSFVYWTQELLAHDLLAPGARIIGLTNPMVDSNVDGWGMVAAAKAALTTYVKFLALELRHKGHRVMLIKFGLVETRAIRMAFGEAEWAALRARIEQLTPDGRLCDVEDVARLVSQLDGDCADWFHGTTIDFTGGQADSLLDKIFHPPKERS